MKSRSKRTKAKRQPKSDGQTGAKKEKRRKKRTGKKEEKEKKENLEPRPPVSPLIDDPQRALQELLHRWPVRREEDGGESLDSLRTQLYEREAARCQHQPVEERVCPSKKTCRFQLPIDLKELEALCPGSYLRRFCLVCQRRRNLYRKVFVKFDRDRDGLLSLKELQGAVCDLYVADVSVRQLQRLTTLVAADAKSRFDFAALCVTCALSERLFYSALGSEDLEEDGGRDRLEEVDFNSLMVKIQHYSVPPALTTLLRTISEDCL